MISLNYFFRKNGSGEIIAKVLTYSVIQHYLPDFPSLRLYIFVIKISITIGLMQRRLWNIQ